MTLDLEGFIGLRSPLEFGVCGCHDRCRCNDNESILELEH